MKEEQERTPLRTILTNFLNHIENLEARRPTEDSYETEFQELKLFSESIKGTKQYSCSEGEKDVNRKKNRYKDILPFDVSRVSLNEYAGIPGSDYINANFIKGASGSPAYIASQGPLPHTVNDFWRMVVQCEVQVIVMACNEEEAGKHKCENYWVEKDGEEKQFGMVSIRLIKASTVCPDFSVRTMRLKYTNTQSIMEERTVCQFHYSAWPDHGVPPLVRPLLDMVRLVRDTQASETLPVLVHCSAGCGRTGTICAIDYVWGLLRAGKLTKDFSLLSLVREMRKQRIAMVQTKEQYILVHQAVRELFKEQLRMIDSHPYENIDCNGLPLIKSPSPENEPTYDTITRYQPNNISEEKQDEKEKESVAPPIPQKKKFILSSKHEKEVENLTERQRLVERAESSSESMTSSSPSVSSGHRPRIAKLKSFFERNSSRESRRSTHISRSHSLGAVRNRQVSSTDQTDLPVKEEVKEPIVKESSRPIPYKGILRVPQIAEQPVLPVKRSKSLRVLGTGDRYKLSIPLGPAPMYDIDRPPNIAEKTRRLSLESNIDEMRETDRKSSCEHEYNRMIRNSQDYLSVGVVDAIVAGLGVRERRNSFRQAMNRVDTDLSLKDRRDIEKMWVTPQRRPGLLRSYTSIDMRTTHLIKQDVGSINSAPPKPTLRPKPIVSKTKPQSDKSLDVYRPSTKQPSNSAYHLKSRSQLNSSSSNPYKPLDHPKPLPKNRTGEKEMSSSQPRLEKSQTRQKDLSYPFKTEYINANQNKILQPLHSSQIITPHHSKSYSIPKDIPLKEPFVDPRFITNSKEFTPIKNVRSRNNVQITGSRSITASLSDSSVRQNQDLGTTKNQQSIIEQKLIQNKSLSHGQDVRSQLNLKPQEVANNSGMNYELIKKSSNHKMTSCSKPRPIVYDSRNSQQDLIYASRPKAPPPYLEASRQAMYKSQFNHHKNSSTTNIDPRYVQTNMKLYNEPIQIPNDRNSSQTQDIKGSSQVDDRPKYIDSSNYPHFKNTDSYPLPQHDISSGERQNITPNVRSNEMRSRPSVQIGIKNNESRLKPSNIKDTRESQIQTNQQPILNRASDTRSNTILHDGRYLELKPNTILALDSRNHEVRRHPPNYDSPHSSDSRQIKHLYSHYTPNRNIQQEPIYKIDKQKSRQTDEQPNSESDPTNQGVKLRRGSRDDMALCSTYNTPSRVKRHASVVMLRHSLIETPQSGEQASAPLTVWNESKETKTDSPQYNKKNEEDPWSGAVGVDLDQVAASIPLKDGTSTKFMRAALESLHLRKGTAPQTTENAESKTMKSSNTGTPSQPVQAFRKQQQYL
uniref:protein-tyrosine-phosphatase n=1 Tax=Clastoptera arizonana TaxID=38151 RepID=A0A1B6E8P0_9HEMI